MSQICKKNIPDQAIKLFPSFSLTIILCRVASQLGGSLRGIPPKVLGFQKDALGVDGGLADDYKVSEMYTLVDS